MLAGSILLLWSHPAHPPAAHRQKVVRDVSGPILEIKALYYVEWSSHPKHYLKGYHDIIRLVVSSLETRTPYYVIIMTRRRTSDVMRGRDSGFAKGR